MPIVHNFYFKILISTSNNYKAGSCVNFHSLLGRKYIFINLRKIL